MRPFTVTLVGCYGRFGFNSAEFPGTNSSSSTYTSVAVQLQLHRGRGEGGVCTWLVLRVPRQYISTQTGLLGQAEMADGVDLRCPGLLITVGARAGTGTWEAKS
jgi:hypothetical protein